jgi:hypothetical protein
MGREGEVMGEPEPAPRRRDERARWSTHLLSRPPDGTYLAADLHKQQRRVVHSGLAYPVRRGTFARFGSLGHLWGGLPLGDAVP